MSNASEASSHSSHPPPRWFSKIVPLAPIALAIVVAVVAAYYGGPREPSVGHFSGVDTGAQAPDFVLPDSNGKPVKLSEITPKKIVVLVFYLGYGCPRCVKNLRDLEDSAELNAANVQVLAISPDTIEQSQNAIKEFGGFPFPLLSDSDKRVAQDYGLTLPDGQMLHGVFVVDQQNKLRFAVRSDRPYDNLPELLERVREQQR